MLCHGQGERRPSRRLSSTGKCWLTWGIEISGLDFHFPTPLWSSHTLVVSVTCKSPNVVGIMKSISPHWERKCSMLSSLPRIPIIRGREQHCIKNTDFVADPMRGSGAKPLEKFKVEQRQEIRSQATEDTAAGPHGRVDWDYSPFSRNARVGAANSNAYGY